MGSKAAIAFLNYRRHDLARAAVRQVYGDPFPVYVFDNGGGLALPEYPRVEVVAREDNLLFTRGWNWAMEHLTQFEYVWMCNDDIWGVGQDMLSILMTALASDPGAAVVSPAFNSPHAPFHRQYEKHGLREVGWMDWTCPVMRMAAWQSVGPFDPRFVGYGADLDWCKRARDAGWKFYVHDGLQVHHLGSQTALSQGLQGVQGNAAEMNRLLCEKWGVGNWTELAGGAK